MIITCERCAARFNLDESLLRPEGSRVRCSLCKHVFTAVPQTKPEAILDTDIPAEQPHGDQDAFADPGSEAPGEDYLGGGTPDLDSLDDLDLDNEIGADDELEFDTDLDFDTDMDFDNDLSLDDDLNLDRDSNGSDDLEISPDLELDTDEEIEIEFDGSDFSDSSLDLEEDDTEDFDAEISFEEVDSDLENETSIDDETTEVLIPDSPDIAEIEDEAGNEESFDLQLDLDMDKPTSTDSLVSDTDAQEEEEPADSDDDHFDEELDFSRFDTVLENGEEEPDGGDETEDDESIDPALEDDSEYEGAPDEDAADETDDEPEESRQNSILLSDKPLSFDDGKDRSSSGFLKTLLSLLFLLVLLVVGATVLTVQGIRIPYVSSYVDTYITPAVSSLNIPFLDRYLGGPTPEPPAEVRLAPDKKSVNGRFVTNSSAGTLFVITGNVTNTSEIVCRHITVKGSLIADDKTVSQVKTVYCGNIIPEEKLKSLDMATIDSMLQDRNGNNGSNMKIEVGRSIPFMIVFSGLPENLQNFTVTVDNFEKQSAMGS